MADYIESNEDNGRVERGTGGRSGFRHGASIQRVQVNHQLILLLLIFDFQTHLLSQNDVRDQ